MTKKNSGARGRKVACDLCEVDFHAGLRGVEDAASFRIRQPARRGGVLGVPFARLERHAPDYSLPGVVADAKVESCSIDDEYLDIERSRADEARWQREIRDVTSHGLFERAHRVQDTSDDVHGEVEAPQLEGDRELEQVPQRKAPAAASSSRLLEVGYHYVFFAEVDQAMLRHAERPGGLRKRQTMHR